MRWQVVHLRPAAKNEQGMGALDARVHWIVELGILHSASAQDFHALFRLFANIIQPPELDRLGGTSLGTRRLQPRLLPVGAERTFERTAVVLVFLHHSKWTGNDAIRAAVADVGLQKDAAELCTYQCARGACLQAACHLTVLADVRGKFPGQLMRIVASDARLRRALD